MVIEIRKQHCRPEIYPDDRLDQALRNVYDRASSLLSIINLINLGVRIGVFWTESFLKNNSFAEYKAATPYEILCGYDGFILVSQNCKMWHDEDLEALICHCLSCFDAMFVGKNSKPIIKIAKRYHEISLDVLSVYGGRHKLYEDFVDKYPPDLEVKKKLKIELI